MAFPCVLVTRPEPQASQWAQALREQGFNAQALPLMTISGPADPMPVAKLWQNLSQQTLLMFVSPAAVEWFFKLKPEHTTWPDTTWAAAPGPGTADKLVELGAAHGLTRQGILAPPPDAAQFDSEALWPVLQRLSWSKQQITIVSGGDAQEAKGRKWLTQQLQAQGAQVDALLCYQRHAAQWSKEQQQLAQQAFKAPRSFIWLLSSSQGLAYLFDELLSGLPTDNTAVPQWAQARALCTHPRITAYAQQKGFGFTFESRPTLNAVVTSLRLLPSPDAGVDTIK